MDRACWHHDCKHFEGLDDVWTDRLGMESIRNRVLAELVARCDRCGANLFIDITGTRARWHIDDSRVGKDEHGRLRHGDPRQGKCGGFLRLHGPAPAHRPRHLLVNEQ